MRTLHPALALLLVASALAGGCGTLPTTEYYQVRCQSAPDMKATRTVESSVTVRPFSAVETYQQPQVAYRTTPYRLYYDPYRKWSSTPAPLVRDQFVRCLRSSELFETVVDGTFPTRTRYQIFGRVLEFYELEEEGARFAVLAVELTLTNADEGPLFSISPTARVQAPPAADLSGVAEAMSRALEQVFTEFLRAAEQRLPHPADSA